MGKKIDRSDHSKKRWLNMIRVALGQSKMVRRPVAGFLHILIYVGFIVINIEMIEIIIDGIFGTHRYLSEILSNFLYAFLISSFEILAFLVLLSCVVFLFRRNLLYIKRFRSNELKSWPTTDANFILIFEILLMLAFLLMNASDSILYERKFSYYDVNIVNPISSYFEFFLVNISNQKLYLFERFCWWFHIIGVLGFLNYVLISKHLHIFFAFPSTYYAKLDPLGKLDNIPSVTNEVKIMLDPNIDPFQKTNSSVDVFGAKDATDLNWVQLLNAYSCTECGRCTDNCPAHITGKMLSPRKILMDTRDRIEEIGYNTRNKINDTKSLLGDYITTEEIWACTSCNACTDACPIELDPLSIIMDMRRYLVMEESKAPQELNMMFTNIENNGAPWQFSSDDRLNWKDE
ncbi:MAG: Fe-S oxidoreductase [Flavobacteriales bacterium]|nr:Fe-S oxidoreductase [Flavobacteriales bacterium]|tara:strand:- start:2586 stop:3797 length:1212 start_codon:yes stop_codon:yes gene_type:complete